MRTSYKFYILQFTLLWSSMLSRVCVSSISNEGNLTILPWLWKQLCMLKGPSGCFLLMPPVCNCLIQICNSFQTHVADSIPSIQEIPPLLLSHCYVSIVTPIMMSSLYMTTPEQLDSLLSHAISLTCLCRLLWDSWGSQTCCQIRYKNVTVRGQIRSCCTPSTD